jgi:hypothetical protein
VDHQWSTGGHGERANRKEAEAAGSRLLMTSQQHPSVVAVGAAVQEAGVDKLLPTDKFYVLTTTSLYTSSPFCPTSLYFFFTAATHFYFLENKGISNLWEKKCT